MPTLKNTRWAALVCAGALAAVAALSAIIAAGCGRQAAAPAAGSGQAASRLRVMSVSPRGEPTAARGPSQASPAAPAARGLPGSTGPGSAPAPVLGQPVTSELRPPAQSVIVDQAPPSTAPPPDRSGADRALAAREHRLAERQAALDARERRMNRQRLPHAGTAGEPGAAAATTPDGPAAPADAAAATPAPGGENRVTGRDGHAGAPDALGEAGPEAGPGAVPAPAAEARERQPAAAAAVPAGTAFEVAFTKGLASNASSVGETFRARVLSDLRVDGMVAVPAGSEVLGVVTDAVEARRIGGQAKLSVKFTDLVLPSGSTVPLRASFLEQGTGRAGRDAATIGGATAGGALLGRILNGSRGRGTIIGALVGAAVGTAIASKTAGEEVVIPEGSVVSLKLDEALEVKPRR